MSEPDQNLESQQQEKPLSTLERVSRIEEALGSAKVALQSTSETSIYAIEKTLSIESSLSSVARLLTALLKELTDKKIVDNDSVYTRMRVADETADKSKLDNMKKSGMLDKKDVVGEMSLVVVGSTLVNAETGDITILSDFMTLDLAVIPPSDKTKVSLVGKKTKDVFELGKTADGSKILYTVKEIYEIKPQKIKGEETLMSEKG